MMQNIGGAGKTLSDIEVKEFLERQDYNIRRVVREVIAEEVIPEIHAVKEASATAHKEIIERLERLENRLT